MIKKTAILLTVTFSVSFFFCTARHNYRTKDIRFRIEQSKEKINKFIDWSETEKNKQEDIYNRLVAMSGNSSLPPYPELKKKLDSMKHRIHVMKMKKQKTDSLSRELDAIARGKEEITPEDPNWQKARTINDDAIIICETIENESSAYKKENERYSDILKEYNIIIPDADMLRRKLRDTIEKLHRNKTDKKNDET